MIAFICLFCPALLSVWCFEGLAKHELTKKKWLYHLSLNLMVINGVCFLFKRFLFETAFYPLYTFSTDMLPSTAINYLIMAIPTAVIFALIRAFCSKNIKIFLEENENEKK